MQRITPFLWFDTQAEEAAKFYTSIFKNSEIVDLNRYGEGGAKASGRAVGSVMTVSFKLDGQDFVALNGGPDATFSQAISFVVNCENQEEVDEFWKKLSEDGKEIQCGWLTDKFGVSWQITPTILLKMLSDPDSAKAERVMNAMLKMVKIDIQTIKQAYEAD